jgi:predicted DNA-binding protein (MmcQ/YjbR family)
MKPGSAPEDRRLVRLTRICLSLPEATRDYNGQHAGFQVRRRSFAYFLNDHHGDGIVGVTCKVFSGDNVALSSANPDKFYLPSYVGSKGWVALRLDRGGIDWDEVRELVTGSYGLVAPQRLAALVLTKPG